MKKWTKEKVFEESKKYTSRQEFKKGNVWVYKISCKNNWLDEMDWLSCRQSKPSGYWTKERCFEEAKKYNKRSDFYKYSFVAYNVSRVHNWLDEMDWLYHKDVKCAGYWTKERCIEESKKYKSRSEYCIKAPGAYESARRNNWLDEMTWFPERLNHWTKERVFEESKKYKTRTEFSKKCNGAYTQASKNKWLDEMVWLSCRTKYWTKERVFEESKKYKSRNEFKNNSGTAYTYALKNKWLDEMTWLSKLNKKPVGYWTKERVFEESKKYKSRNEFKNNSITSYHDACKYGWINDMYWLKRPDKKYWTKERVFEESKKYKTRREFNLGQCSAYETAVDNKWLDDMPWLIKQESKPIGYWTKERVFEESKKYKTRKEFKKFGCGAYTAARRKNWLNEMTWLEEV